VDDNQAEVVHALRRIGYSVAITSALGHGFPDIVVGRAGVNGLFELKDPAKPPSKRRLTEDERHWHIAWQGQVDVVETWEDVVAIMESRIRRSS
jgi:hypothetical protein